MDLVFALQDGQTILLHAYCEIPFKITRVLNRHGGIGHLILMHCSAGLFGGDEIDASIRVERGARILLTQQSATKVHASRNHTAVQRHRLIVEDGAELQLCFEPVIPFADSSLRQSTEIDVASGGRLVFWEGLMAGRIGRGERWRFREFGSETSVRLNGSLIYLERFFLPNGFETSDYAMGNCNYLGTGVLVGEDAASVAAPLHAALPEAGVDILTPQVMTTRVVSSTGPDFYRSRLQFLTLSAHQ